jgi:hypothetical protein
LLALIKRIEAHGTALSPHLVLPPSLSVTAGRGGVHASEPTGIALDNTLLKLTRAATNSQVPQNISVTESGLITVHKFFFCLTHKQRYLSEVSLKSSQIRSRLEALLTASSSSKVEFMRWGQVELVVQEVRAQTGLEIKVECTPGTDLPLGVRVECGGIFHVYVALLSLPARTGEEQPSDEMEVDSPNSVYFQPPSPEVRVRLQHAVASSVTEKKGAWEFSRHGVYRQMSEHLSAAAAHLSATSPQTSLKRLLLHIHLYKDIFHETCKGCKRRLTIEGQLGFLPPTYRDLVSGQAYHTPCIPPSVALP